MKIRDSTSESTDLATTCGGIDALRPLAAVIRLGKSDVVRIVAAV